MLIFSGVSSVQKLDGSTPTISTQKEIQAHQRQYCRRSPCALEGCPVKKLRRWSMSFFRSKPTQRLSRSLYRIWWATTRNWDPITPLDSKVSVGNPTVACYATGGFNPTISQPSEIELGTAQKEACHSNWMFTTAAPANGAIQFPKAFKEEEQSLNWIGKAKSYFERYTPEDEQLEPFTMYRVWKHVYLSIYVSQGGLYSQVSI